VFGQLGSTRPGHQDRVGRFAYLAGVIRSMADRDRSDLPSVFVVDWVRALGKRLPPPRRALDVAMGRGRHAVGLAEAGFKVFGVDVNASAVSAAVTRARSHGLVVHGWCADLRTHPLPRSSFELIVVTSYLQRDLFPSLKEAVSAGGVVLYETFTTAQRVHFRGPTSPDHLLRPGELRTAFEHFEVLAYEEVSEPDAVARIAARRPATKR